MKKFAVYILILSIMLTGLCPVCSPLSAAYASSLSKTWPEMTENVEAEGACLMDAASGVVLFGKNMHEKYYPASITKILTALIVIENCDLDEEVVFSHRAVYDVEEGSSSAGYTEGDCITVRDALYAMLLASANEAANALAEHTAGSIEAFCDLMNEKAAKLGCADSHFANPSGLNNDQHYTTAYDFALICREAFKNDILVQVAGTTYYELPPSIRHPEPFTVYAHHNMLKKSNKLYYNGIIAGKTGYTTLAGNTLVTCAERDSLRLITVVLNGHKTHYSDTKKMLDFGFANYKSVLISDYHTEYDEVYRSMDITGTGLEGSDVIVIQPDARIVLPIDGDFRDTSSVIEYDLDGQAPPNAVARIRYKYGSKNVGFAYIEKTDNYDETVIRIIEEAIGEEEVAEEKGFMPWLASRPLYVKILLGAGAAAVIVALVFLMIRIFGRKRKRETKVSATEIIIGRSRKRH